jgi:hypothetical protein
MSNFVRTQPDGVWVNGYAPPRSDWEDLDRKQREAVNGDNGGAWAPATPLEFGTDGGPDPALVVHGPTLVAYGGELKSVDGGRFVIQGASGNWPRFGADHPFRTRRILTSLLRNMGGSLPDWVVDPATAGIGSIALSVQTTGGVLSSPATLRTELRVHDGARLARATFCFRVPSTLRTRAPVRLPRFRVVRMDRDGYLTPLKSTTLDALGLAGDASGWSSPTPVQSVAAWTLGGATQRFVYLCDRDNVVDVEAYAYFAEIIEEAGATVAVPPSAYDGIVVRERKATCRVASASPPAGTTFSGGLVIDGESCAPGTRVLMKDGIDSNAANTYANGIWIAEAGAWTRATDFDQPSHVTPLAFVDIEAGATNAGSLWQVTSPAPIAMGAWPITFGRLEPAGNLYHSIALDFEDIIDMRPQ